MTTIDNPVKSGWRFFPRAIILGLGFVVVVNAGLIWSAYSTFPGVAGTNTYDTGVNYNLVLDAAAKQAALGWTLEVAAPARRVAVRVMDATGHDLPGAVVTATARRALGTSDAIPLELAAAADGFVASGTLPAAGNWLIDVAVLAQGRLYRATRRLDVL